MRAFGVLLTVVAVCIVFLAPPAASADVRGPRGGEDGTVSDEPGPRPRPLEPRKGATSSFPGTRFGEKEAGWCSITCSNGFGTMTWAWDVLDCACQCSSFCGEACFAWEVGGPDTAFCAMF
jgi:hypothetical protein